MQYTLHMLYHANLDISYCAWMEHVRLSQFCYMDGNDYLNAFLSAVIGQNAFSKKDMRIFGAEDNSTPSRTQ